jgi:glutamine synthetase
MPRTLVEYVWLGGDITDPDDPNQKLLHSKVKVFHHSEEDKEKIASLNPEALPVWTFDGSSTGQAEGKTSDCFLKPVRVTHNPSGNGLIALCEVFVAKDDVFVPHPTNTRAQLRTAVSNGGVELEPLFGFEQEYTLFQEGKPLGWPETGEPEPQGPYYCSVGADRTFGRNLVNSHMLACIDVGLPISGINAEVMPGQWEYQIGPVDPVTAADCVWIARYLLDRMGEHVNTTISLDPKPVSGDWNGAGMHTNFSTKQTREEDGISYLKKLCEGLSTRIDEHISVYGKGIENRLTGKHETCSLQEFRYGVGDRTASIRIPLHVAVQKSGYLEDRRPCANADPYEVARVIVESAVSILGADTEGANQSETLLVQEQEATS